MQDVSEACEQSLEGQVRVLDVARREGARAPNEQQPAVRECCSGLRSSLLYARYVGHVILVSLCQFASTQASRLRVPRSARCRPARFVLTVCLNRCNK